jgi:hypothetical protein
VAAKLMAPAVAAAAALWLFTLDLAACQSGALAAEVLLLLLHGWGAVPLVGEGEGEGEALAVERTGEESAVLGALRLRHRSSQPNSPFVMQESSFVIQAGQ